MRGYLCFASSKSEANFSRGETGYRAPQVGTFGVALNSVSFSYKDLCAYSERMNEFFDKGRKNGLYSKKNYVSKVPYGTLVYVDSWFKEDALAVVKLCVITDIGKTIGVRSKWAVLQWDWDYNKDDEDRDYREFTDWLDLEDQAVINGLKLSYRPEVLKDPEKLVYKVKDVKDEITGDDAGVVGPAGPKPEDFIKTTENPKYKEVKLDGKWVKERYEAIRKGEVLLVEGAVLHDILNEAGKNLYNFLGNALGLYSIRLIEKKGATDGVSELYTGTLMNLQENITRTFVKLYDKIEEKAYKTKFEEDENG